MPKPIPFKIENRILKKCYTSDAEIIVPDGIVSISSYAFAHCKNLRKITIPDSVKRICIGAFRHCRNLQSIVIPEGVEHIGKQAFEECYALREIVIPDSVKHIGEKAFFKQLRLSSCAIAPCSKDPEQAKMLISALRFSNLWLPFLKEAIRTNEAAEKILLQKVTSKAFRIKKIPMLIAMEETEAFKKIFSLLRYANLSAEELDVYLNASLGKVEMTNFLIAYRNERYPLERVLEMQQEEMEKSLGLREKTLADYRKEFTIVKKNGICTITKCKSKESTVVIPGEIQGAPVALEKYAFAGCYGLETLYIEEGVTHLDNYVFASCYNLKRVEIPHSVTCIEPYSFYRCLQLKEICFDGNKDEWYRISSMFYFCTCEVVCTDGKILFFA